jgi:hypothetical protein
MSDLNKTLNTMAVTQLLNDLYRVRRNFKVLVAAACEARGVHPLAPEGQQTPKDTAQAALLLGVKAAEGLDAAECFTVFLGDLLLGVEGTNATTKEVRGAGTGPDSSGTTEVQDPDSTLN